MNQKYSKHFINRSLLFLFGFLACFQPAYADTVKISADVWGSVRDVGRNGVFDSVISTDAIFANNIVTAGGILDRGVWEFDLSELPSGSITSINLEVVLASTTLGLPNHEIYQYVGDGVINIADATAGTFLSTSVGGLNDPMDVTSFILDAATLASGFAGFNVRLSGEFQPFTIQKSWQTPGFVANSPWLVVEYSNPAVVPVPAAAWLFGTALIGLVGFSRRKKRPGL